MEFYSILIAQQALTDRGQLEIWSSLWKILERILSCVCSETILKSERAPKWEWMVDEDSRCSSNDHNGKSIFSSKSNLINDRSAWSCVFTLQEALVRVFQGRKAFVVLLFCHNSILFYSILCQTSILSCKLYPILPPLYSSYSEPLVRTAGNQTTNKAVADDTPITRCREFGAK